MTYIRTATGRLIRAPAPDPLKGRLRLEAEAAAQHRSPPPANPIGRALILGTGRLGAWVAMLLARMGIAIGVVDRDVVEGRNLDLGNTPFRPKDIGLPKAQALKRLLADLAPDAPVEAHQADLVLMPEAELIALVEATQLVLGLVDDGEALLRINDLAYRRRPALYAAGHRAARTGDVLISRPGGACLRCLLNVQSPADIQTLAGEQTHGADILLIAEVTTRIAVGLLGDPRLADAHDLLDPSVNFVFLENRRSPSSPGGFAPRFLRIERRRTCPVCGAR